MKLVSSALSLFRQLLRFICSALLQRAQLPRPNLIPNFFIRYRCGRRSPKPGLDLPKMRDAKGEESRDPNQTGFSHFPGARRILPQELLLIWRSLYCFLFCLDHESHPVGRSSGSAGGGSMGSGGGGSAEDRDSAMEFVGGCWEGEGVCNELGGGMSVRGRLGVGTRLKGEAVTGNGIGGV